MKKSYLYIILAICFLSISVLTVGFLYQTYKASTQYYLLEVLRDIELGSDINLLEQKLGKAMYKTTDPKWNDRKWYQKNFTVNIRNDEHCYVFYPPETWSNQLIVVITDMNGKIKWATPRET